ncbi:MAG: hypothetical protein GZ089_00375 [Aromatoleum sp.]|nr:hypothetical protein [Aromatoleum sp.]
MTPHTALRILRESYFGGGLRQTYWNARALGGELARLFERDNATFRRHAVRDLARFAFGTVRPVEGEITKRSRAAVDWILRAQQATPDDGVSLGYFPCSRDERAWKPSYPETTGYIVTSLLHFAERFGDDAVRAAALRMARWEIGVQMNSGAVQGGPVCPPPQQTAAAFNTGMVLDGWCSAYAVARDPAMLAAARRAADWLVGDLDGDGYFRTNGAFVSVGEVKTYACLCGWALYRYGDIVADDRYREAAVRCVEAALRQQQTNGWFAHNCLARSEAPLTHTIGYTLQGVLEVGMLARRDDFVMAVRKCADRIIPRISSRGYLPGLFYADWEPARFSSCLTGSAQIAIVCYRLNETTGIGDYRLAADRLVNYLKALQALESPLPAIKGGIAGSLPLFGEYMRGGYPNWATKYFLDALLLQDRAPRALGGVS